MCQHTRYFAAVFSLGLVHVHFDQDGLAVRFHGLLQQGGEESAGSAPAGSGGGMPGEEPLVSFWSDATSSHTVSFDSRTRRKSRR